jgi:ribosomal protein S18 acetylase RimI-like enzyme
MDFQSLPVVIRPIQDKDLPDILLVYRQCQDFLALGPDPIASEQMVWQDIEVSRREGGCFCGIFQHDGRLIGVVDYVLENFVGSPQAFISLLMIATPYRRHNLGQQAIRQIEAKIRKNKQIRAVLTAVQINNPLALRFWQKNGYRIVGDPKVQPDTTITYRLRKDL